MTFKIKRLKTTEYYLAANKLVKLFYKQLNNVLKTNYILL